jgi:hypothetical protein
LTPPSFISVRFHLLIRKKSRNPSDVKQNQTDAFRIFPSQKQDIPRTFHHIPVKQTLWILLFPLLIPFCPFGKIRKNLKNGRRKSICVICVVPEKKKETFALSPPSPTLALFSFSQDDKYGLKKY